jgi:hypothetical protein
MRVTSIRGYHRVHFLRDLSNGEVFHVFEGYAPGKDFLSQMEKLLWRHPHFRYAYPDTARFFQVDPGSIYMSSDFADLLGKCGYRLVPPSGH